MSLCLVCGKAEHGECRCDEINEQIIRNAALEEAAKVAQQFKWSTDNDSEVTELLAHRIRALKTTKPATTKE